MYFELYGMQVENVSGFTKAKILLNRRSIVLVGPNNAGKTSLLRILEWSFRGADRKLFLGKRELDPSEARTLFPARDTRNSARRVTLQIAISDGRTAKKFRAVNGIASVRIRILSSGIYAALGAPHRGERQGSDPLAIELIERLQDHYSVTYVPSSRDATSEYFSELLTAQLRPLLEKRILHKSQGGTTAEYRKVKGTLETIAKVAESQANLLWSRVQQQMPREMKTSATFQMDVDHHRLIDWMMEMLNARFSTGRHDALKVSPEDLGTGLQSMLMLALLRLAQVPAQKSLLLLEEPEAFLHPSAQRLAARELFDDGDLDVITSTHSPVIVDESRAPDVALVIDRKVYQSRDAGGQRADINSSLLVGQGSEAFFSRSLLLVEGPGDKSFFERLRRRMYEILPGDIVSQLSVVAVGGHSNFAPWIQLLDSYEDRATGERPIHWLVTADSIDSVAAVIQALANAECTLPIAIRNSLRAIEQGRKVDASGQNNSAIVASQTAQANLRAVEGELRVHLMPVDLEYSAIVSTSKATLGKIQSAINAPSGSAGELMSWLGSKGGSDGASNKNKAPWMRDMIAELTPWRELSVEVRFILRRWIEPLLPAGFLVPSSLKP